MRRQGTIDSQLSLENEICRNETLVTLLDDDKETRAETNDSVADADGSVCDWSKNAVPDCHMWSPSSSGAEVISVFQGFCSVAILSPVLFVDADRKPLMIY